MRYTGCNRITRTVFFSQYRYICLPVEAAIVNFFVEGPSNIDLEHHASLGPVVTVLGQIMCHPKIANIFASKITVFTLFRGKLQIFGHWSLKISSIPILVRNYGTFAIQLKKEEGSKSRPKNEHVRISMPSLQNCKRSLRP